MKKTQHLRSLLVLLTVFFFASCSVLDSASSGSSGDDSGDDAETTDDEPVYAANEMVWACPADGTVSFEAVSDVGDVSLTTAASEEISSGTGQVIRILGNLAEDYNEENLEPVFYLLDAVLIEMTDGRFVLAETNLTPQEWYFNSENIEYIQTRMYFYESSESEMSTAIDSVLADLQARDEAGENLGNVSLLDELDANESLEKVAAVSPLLTPLGGNTEVSFSDSDFYTLTTTIDEAELTLYVDQDETDYVTLFARYAGMTLALELSYDVTQLNADYPEYFMHAGSAGSLSLGVEDRFVLLDAEGATLETYNDDDFDPMTVFYEKCGMELTEDSLSVSAIEIFNL